MSNVLGNLIVKLGINTSPFERGVQAAAKQTDSFEKSLKKFSDSTLASVLSIGAFTAGVKTSLEQANEFNRVTNELAASAKIAGQSLDSLNAVVAEGHDKFGLSKTMATEFAVEISKLADKTGGLKDPSRVLENFLNVGAARGLTAAQSLDALRAAVKGSDDGLQVLLNRKPDQLFNEFAASVHTTADKLSEQGKAQAVVNAVMAEGSSVRGEYQRWLQSTEGIQFQLSQGLTDASTVIGEAFQPALGALIPVFKLVASAIETIGVGIAAVIADFQMLPALAQAAGQAMQGNFQQAAQTVQQANAQWEKTVQSVKDMAHSAAAGVKAPGPLTGRGTGGAIKSDAPETAGQRADILRDDAIAKARAQAELDEEQLGTQATLLDKLAIELDLNQRIYEIKKQSIEADTRLSSSQKANELLKAKLEKENADFSVTGKADVEHQNSELEKLLKVAKEKGQTIGDAIGGTIGALTSGHGISGAQIGQNVGMLAGAFMPALAPFAAGIGGFLGGLFDKKKKDDQEGAAPIVKGLDAIERAQRDTITTLNAQTNALLNPQDQFLNLPSNFNVPSYAPSPGGSSVAYGDTYNNIALNVSAPSGGGLSANAIARLIYDELGDLLSENRRNIPWGHNAARVGGVGGSVSSGVRHFQITAAGDQALRDPVSPGIHGGGVMPLSTK